MGPGRGGLCEGFVNAVNPRSVLKLSKILYVLRRASRAWYAKLDSSLYDFGFVRSPLEHAAYRRGDDTSYLLMGVYGDLIITGTDVGDFGDILAFKDEMHHLFKMSDLGPLSSYRGIEVN